MKLKFVFRCLIDTPLKSQDEKCYKQGLMKSRVNLRKRWCRWFGWKVASFIITIFYIPFCVRWPICIWVLFNHKNKLYFKRRMVTVNMIKIAFELIVIPLTISFQVRISGKEWKSKMLLYCAT